MRLVDECYDSVKKDYFKYLNKEKITGKSKSKKIKSLKKIYIPLSFWIENKYKKKDKILFLGLCGGQGSGKTTVAGILKIILKKFFKREIYVSSIDDFYKTLKDRDKISSSIHPLFKTRGVPGTHDTNLIKKFFIYIRKKNFRKFKIPKFDKSADDRFKKKYWHIINKRPVNILEKYEDKNLVWRKHVNKKLKNEYKKIFSIIDHFIFMKIPNFDLVFKWRLLQENKLKKKSQFKKKIMSYNEIRRFIMFYQRITLQMIKDLSKSASIIMLLKKNHEIKKLLFKF